MPGIMLVSRWYSTQIEPDSVMITVTIVGERLEIDVFEDGHVEFSRFMGDEGVHSDVEQLETLIRQHGREQDTG